MIPNYKMNNPKTPMHMYSVSELLEKVNRHVENLQFARMPQELYEPVRYVLSMGGKRLRPTLMLMAYNLYKDDVDSIMAPASGIEIYHNYTLLHDDLMDRADRRRGKQTVHKVWGDNAAILSGDAMLVLAYRYMSQVADRHLPQVLQLFTQTALEICEGQQMDMNFESRNDVTESEYIEMIRLKTSVLLAASLKTGAWLADCNPQDADILYALGISMGLAFQLKDDYLDVYGNPDVFGKNIGGDILCGKKTYLLIQAMEHADAGQRHRLDIWLNDKTAAPEEKIKAVTALYNETGANRLCEEKMDHYSREAGKLLHSLALPEERKTQLQHLLEDLNVRQK